MTRISRKTALRNNKNKKFLEKIIFCLEVTKYATKTIVHLTKFVGLPNFGRPGLGPIPGWGPYGPIYGPIWALMGPYVGPYGPIWAHMDPYGPIRALMGPMGVGGMA